MLIHDKSDARLKHADAVPHAGKDISPQSQGAEGSAEPPEVCDSVSWTTASGVEARRTVTQRKDTGEIETTETSEFQCSGGKFIATKEYIKGPTSLFPEENHSRIHKGRRRHKVFAEDNDLTGPGYKVGVDWEIGNVSAVQIGKATVAGKVDAKAIALSESLIKKTDGHHKDDTNRGLIADAMANAGVGAEGGIKTKDSIITGRAEIGIHQRAHGEASGRFNVSHDTFDMGFKVAGEIETGPYQQLSGGTRTKGGSGIACEIEFDEGDIGGSLGAGLRINSKGIHADFEVSGGMGVGIDLRVGLDIKYEDIRRSPAAMIGTIIAGPIGFIVGRAVEHVISAVTARSKKVYHYVEHKAAELTPHWEYRKTHSNMTAPAHPPDDRPVHDSAAIEDIGSPE